MSVHMLHVRSGNDCCSVIVDEHGMKESWEIPPMTEFAVMHHGKNGIPFVAFVEFTEDGKVVVHDIDLHDVRVDSDDPDPWGVKMVVRGTYDDQVEFDVLSEPHCAYDFDLVHSTAKFVFDLMNRKK